MNNSQDPEYLAPRTPEQVQANWDEIASGLQDDALVSYENIGENLTNIGPSMAGAGPGGSMQFDIDRFSSPVVDTIASNLVKTARMEAINARLTQLAEEAQNEYDSARRRYSSSGGGSSGTPASTIAQLMNQLNGNTTFNETPDDPNKPNDPGISRNNLVRNLVDRWNNGSRSTNDFNEALSRVGLTSEDYDVYIASGGTPRK